jgi:prepilin-type N-terminal cleavage/methylation domain-containing protein
MTTIHHPHPAATTKERLMKALIQNRRKHSDEGFTLIELLLVIIILGILAAVVVFSVRGVSDRGQSSACKTSRAATITALEAYYATNGIYPADLGVLKTAGFASDLPNPGAFVGGDLNRPMSVNGPTSNGTPQWTITYTAGSPYGLAVTPAGFSC